MHAFLMQDKWLDEFKKTKSFAGHHEHPLPHSCVEPVCSQRTITTFTQEPVQLCHFVLVSGDGVAVVFGAKSMPYPSLLMRCFRLAVWCRRAGWRPCFNPERCWACDHWSAVSEQIC